MTDIRKLISEAAGAFVGGMLLVSLLALIIVPMGPIPTATAAAPRCIQNGDEGAIATVEDLGGSASDNSRATRSKMFVGRGPTPCQRITSLYVYSPTFNGGFEFGWVIGYSNCSGVTYRRPTLFYWAYLNTGERKGCHVWGGRHPKGGRYYRFRVSDINANTYWGSYYRGNALQPHGVNMDFARGWSGAAMERGGRRDHGQTRWNLLNEYHDGNRWSRWDDADLAADRDPRYRWRRISAYSVRVVRE